MEVRHDRNKTRLLENDHTVWPAWQRRVRSDLFYDCGVKKTYSESTLGLVIFMRDMYEYMDEKITSFPCLKADIGDTEKTAEMYFRDLEPLYMVRLVKRVGELGVGAPYPEVWDY